MWVVNMVTKTPEMTNAMHFAKKFVAIVAEISKPNYEEIRIIFVKECQVFSFPHQDKNRANKIHHREAYPILPRETTEGLDYASYSDGD